MMFFEFFQQLSWWRLIKFVITGSIALGVDVGVYYLLTRYGGLYYLLARTISLGIAIVWNFSINRYWTFQAISGNIKKQAMKFLAVIGSTSLLSLILMHFGVTILHYPDLVVILVVSLFITMMNFSAHSLWSYS